MPEHSGSSGRATPTPTTESGRYRSGLAEVEQEGGRPAFILTRTEIKLLGIAGVSGHTLNIIRVADCACSTRLGFSWMVDRRLLSLHE